MYRANERHTRLTAEHFQYHYDEGTSGPYINYREVFARFELRAGHTSITKFQLEYRVTLVVEYLG